MILNLEGTMISANELKVIDINLALNLLEGYEQIYQMIVLSFLENESNLIERIESNLPHKFEEARRLVHSCKGISKNLGSLPLYEIALELELALIEHNLDLVELYLPKFKSIFYEVLTDLAKIQFIK